MKNILPFIKKERIPVRLFSPGEPGQHEQLYWLVRFIKQLKDEVTKLEDVVAKLKEDKKALHLQIRGKEPLTDAEQEVLELRFQVQDLWKEQARLKTKCEILHQRNYELNREIDQRDWEALNAA